MRQDKKESNGLNLFTFNIKNARIGMLFIMFMLVFQGFAQTISSDTIDPKYKICFEGKFKNTKIEIFADDSLCYSGSISNEKNDIIEVAECIDLSFIPKKIKIVINHGTILHYTCNPAKPFLYCKRIWFWHYSIYDKAKQQWYR